MDDVQPRPGELLAACPHVDRIDARCGTRFSLGRIDQAFSVCFGAFHGCPMYHRINSEVPQPAAIPALVTITVSHAATVPLRATGT